MHSFSMRPAKYFYDKPLPKYLDPKTVLIYRPHPVCYKQNNSFIYNLISVIFQFFLLTPLQYFYHF